MISFPVEVLFLNVLPAFPVSSLLPCDGVKSSEPHPVALVIPISGFSGNPPGKCGGGGTL